MRAAMTPIDTDWRRNRTDPSPNRAFAPTVWNEYTSPLFVQFMDMLRPAAGPPVGDAVGFAGSHPSKTNGVRWSAQPAAEVNSFPVNRPRAYSSGAPPTSTNSRVFDVPSWIWFSANP